VKEMKRSFGYL